MRNSDVNVWNNWQWENEEWHQIALGEAKKILKAQKKYEEVQNVVGFEWQMIGIIHSLECGLDFNGWLANGDPLTAPTVQVPEGLGVGYSFPISWNDAAVLSLKHDGVPKSVIDIKEAARIFEAFNGQGYKNRDIPSPYLYSGCKEYVKGKYVRDGKFDPNAVSQQIGAICLLRALSELGAVQIKQDGIIQWGKSMPKVTWFDVQKGPTVTAYAGENPVDQWKGGTSDELAKFLTQYGSHSVLFAPVDKPIPVIGVKPVEPSKPAPKPRFNQILFDFYSSKENYDAVYDEVMNWYGTTTNGCAAFCSTALRMCGLAVPFGQDANGNDRSLVTLGLADWLENKGWVRHTNAADLKKGDVILSEEDGRDPGYPAHVFVFAGWENQAKGSGLCIDNNGFTHGRNIVGYEQYSRTPMDYFLRSPN